MKCNGDDVPILIGKLQITNIGPVEGRPLVLRGIHCNEQDARYRWRLARVNKLIYSDLECS